ncbi:MAG TPA: hypothetical protein VF737_01470 [Gemmatimonadaceae bacterium]
MTVTPPSPDAGTSHGALRTNRIVAQFPTSSGSGTMELRDSVTNSLLWSVAVTGLWDMAFLSQISADAVGNGLTVSCPGATVAIYAGYDVYSP